MELRGEGKLIRVFIGEQDKWNSRPLHEAIVMKAREEGLAGATAIKGFLGFGANSRLHTSKLLRLSEDLPIIVELVDSAEKIDRFLPTLDSMVKDGLITEEPVSVRIYRAAK